MIGKSRIISAILSIATVTILFAGCGSTSTTKESTSATTTQAATTAAPATKPELKILVTYDTSVNEKNSKVLQIIVETGGYKLTYDTLPEKNYLDKLNLMFAGNGVDYDLIRLGATDEEKNVFASYAKRGQLVQLDEMLKKYPNLSKMDPAMFEATKIDGKIMGFASTGLPLPMSNNVIRKDWLDAVGLQVPTNKDELYNVLKAFKDQDPGKQGEKNIPFVSSGESAFSAGISAMFGFVYDYQVVDGRIADMRLTENYKNYLTYMNRLYKDGLLDQDFPINQDSTIKQKMAAGNAGFYVGWVEAGRDALINLRKEGKTNVKITAIPPFKDADGKQIALSSVGIQNLSFIPASSKNAEAVLDWMNTIYEASNFEFLVNGKEGEDFTVKDGKRYPILPRFDELRGTLYAFLPVQDGKSYYPLWQMRTRKSPEYSEVFETFVANTDQYKVTSPLAFAPPFAKAAQTVKIVNDFIKQESVKFIARAIPLSDFDKFVQGAKSKGADEVVKEYNEWYLTANK